MGEKTASALDLNQFIVKEHVGLLKLTDTYDIIDPQTQKKVALARETPPGWAKYLRLLVNKQLLPTAVTVTEGETEKGPVLFRIVRPFALFRKTVEVQDATGQKVGHFKSKFFSIGGGFWVYDTKDAQVAEVKGDWKGWNFKFISSSGEEMGSVSKKWEGLATIAKALFTSADTYGVTINPGAAKDRSAKILLLAAALAIDVVYRESGKR